MAVVSGARDGGLALRRLGELILDRGNWRGCFAMVLVVAATDFWVLRRVHPGASGTLTLWISSLASLRALLWLSLACTWPKRGGLGVRLACSVVTWLGLIWLGASTELWVEQDRPLLPAEVWFRITDPISRRFVVETFSSVRVVAFTVAFLALAAGAAALARRVPNRSAAACTLAVLAIVHLSDAYRALVASDRALDVEERMVCAPWAYDGRYLRRSMLAGDVQLVPHGDGASSVRHTLAPPFWSAGPEERLAVLRGRYPRRNVVMIVLESHRLSDVAPWGEGAAGHQGLSPSLSRLAARGLAFTGYIQAGPSTFFAQFSLITGLPASPFLRSGGAAGSAAFARLGRVPDLRAAGYVCEWLQATSPRFDDWEEFLASVGMAGWLAPFEASGLDKSLWTSWGMPDESLYALARRRYLRRSAEGPYFLALLTISNHSPFRFPARPGRVFAANHAGGMSYADEELGGFVAWLLSLPEPQRPLIFITADHSHREGLAGQGPLGVYSLESVRIPGLLLLPDGAEAGQTHDAPFSHEDALDLLLMLVAPSRSTGGEKFVHLHRTAVATITDDKVSVITQRLYCSAPGGDVFAIQGLWRIDRDSEAGDKGLCVEAREAGERAVKLMWTSIRRQHSGGD
jgi:hypothetical protein